MWSSREVSFSDKFALYAVICVVLLVCLPPVGIIMLGLFFPVFLISMLFIGIWDVIRNAFSK